VAQFRFKDEEEWIDNAGETTTAPLNLDLNSLVASLDCIPLHERLGLDKNIFTVSLF